MKDYEIVTEGEPVRLVRCGDYIAASDGKIYKMNWKRTGKMREVKQSKLSNGYLVFWFNGKLMYSHRFIAMCFIENHDNLSQVNHKNEIKYDNRVENLEWCTSDYNNNYGTRNERSAKSHSIPVSQYTKDCEFITTYPSVLEAARQTGVWPTVISKCCRGKLKSAGGFIWRFAD